MNVAILIGTENYTDPSEKLTSPINDVELIEKYLVEYCRYTQAHIYTKKIPDGSPQRGAEKEICAIFASLPKTKIDNFLFYFSGHGGCDTSNTSFLWLNDCEKLIIEDVSRKIASLKPSKSYIIIDSCEAGSKVINTYDGFHIDDSLGFFGVFASTPTTSAYANKDISLFTKAFCDTLDNYFIYTNNEISINQIYSSIYTSFETRGISQRISIQEAQKDVQSFAFWNKAIPFSTPPKIDPIYIERSDEGNLLGQLFKDKMLLLCGDTKIGKTYLSLSLAKKLWKQGYDVLQTDTIDTARDFLSLTDHLRVCILDDPYGSWKGQVKNDRHKTISEIIQNKPLTNLLIITSRKDIILEVYACDTIDKCKEGSISFLEITSEKEMLLEAWYSYAYIKNITEGKINEFAEYINSSQNQLTIGNLKTISLMLNSDIETKSLSEIVHLAQIEASVQAGIYLNQNPSLWHICSVLALTSNTIHGINYDDLKYILNNAYEYPSFEKRKNRFDFGTSLFHKPQIPKYENQKDLTPEIIANIDWLEQQNLITVDNAIIRFTHPYHQEVCIYMMTRVLGSRIEPLINYLYNSLNCTNPDVAFLCSVNIEYVISDNPRIKQALIDIPLAYLQDPVYPKVRDSILLYFINRKISITKDEEKELAERIASGASKYIYWHEGIPFYDDFAIIHEYKLEPITKEQYDSGVRKAISKSYLSAKEINQLLLFHCNNEIDFCEDLYTRSLSAEDGFIRSAGMHYLFDYVGKIQDEYFGAMLNFSLSRLLPDAGFRSIVLSLNSLIKVDKGLKIIILEYLKKLIQDEKICLRCSTLFFHFSHDYDRDYISWHKLSEAQQKEMWKLWSEIFPVFLSNMDEGLAAYLMSGRYSHTIIEFQKNSDVNEFVKLFGAILEFSKRQLESNSFFHTDQLVPFSLLIEVTRNMPQERGDLINEIFKIRDSYLMYYLTSVCTTLWDSCTHAEKDIIKAYSFEDKYAAALILYSPDCPVEMIHWITGNDSLKTDDIESIVSELDPDLLNCCIDVFTENKLLTNYYYNPHHKQTLSSKILTFLFAHDNERICDISATLLSFKMMDVDMWFKACKSTKHLEELAKALSTVSESGYDIVDYDNYWLFLFTKFISEGKEEEFAKHYFRATLSLLIPNYAEIKDMPRFFSKVVFDYYNSKRFQSIWDEIEVEIRNKRYRFND